MLSMIDANVPEHRMTDGWFRALGSHREGLLKALMSAGRRLVILIFGSDFKALMSALGSHREGLLWRLGFSARHHEQFC